MFSRYNEPSKNHTIQVNHDLVDHIYIRGGNIQLWPKKEKGIEVRKIIQDTREEFKSLDSIDLIHGCFRFKDDYEAFKMAAKLLRLDDEVIRTTSELYKEALMRETMFQRLYEERIRELDNKKIKKKAKHPSPEQEVIRKTEELPGHMAEGAIKEILENSQDILDSYIKSVMFTRDLRLHLRMCCDDELQKKVATLLILNKFDDDFNALDKLFFKLRQAFTKPKVCPRRIPKLMFILLGMKNHPGCLRDLSWLFIKGKKGFPKNFEIAKYCIKKAHEIVRKSSKREERFGKFINSHTERYKEELTGWEEPLTIDLLADYLSQSKLLDDFKEKNFSKESEVANTPNGGPL